MYLSRFFELDLENLYDRSCYQMTRLCGKKGLVAPSSGGKKGLVFPSPHVKINVGDAILCTPHTVLADSAKIGKNVAKCENPETSVSFRREANFRN